MPSTPDLSNFGEAKATFSQIHAQWILEEQRSEARRQLRYFHVDTETERKNGTIDQDAFLIPGRVIDNNIRAEAPAFVNFITSATKLITMIDKRDKHFKTEALEDEFASGMKYCGWELDWSMAIDGAQLHGWDSVEVLYDKERPLNVSIEHVGHDKLFFALDLIDLQAAPFIIRQYMMTDVQLENMVANFGFDAKIADELTGFDHRRKEDVTNKIFKMFYKEGGKVFVSWFSDKGSDWLKKPAPFYNGVREKKVGIDPMTGQPTEEWIDTQETQYPIFLLLYDRNENHRIYDVNGRGFLDVPRQEAVTAIVSAFVTRLQRSSHIMAAPSNPQGASAGVEQSDTQIKGSRWFKEPMTFFTMPPPDAKSVLGALEYFDAQNKQDTKQFTDALRDKNERVTAYAYQAAQQDAALLTSVQIMLLSTTVRAVYSYVWRIVRSQALQGLIPLCLIEEDVQNGTFRNDESILNRLYDIRAAGDTEVVQRAQKIQKMLQMWPIMANTPAAQAFLADMVKLLFPDQALTYVKALESPQQNGQQLVQLLYGMIQTILQQHPDAAQLNPQEQQQWQQVQQMVQNFIGQGQQQQAAPAQPVPAQQPQPPQ